MKLDKVSEYMEKVGIPGRDAYDLPSSNKRFPDGASYRIEIAGIAGPKVLEALVAERRKRNVPVHRIISLDQGGTLFDEQELKDFAQMAAEEKIEVIALAGPRNAWDIGRQLVSSEGQVAGARHHRGSDELRKIIADIMRMYDAGLRGFLIWDLGVMWLIKKMQDQGNFPKDVALKVSAAVGISSAAGVRLADELGVSSFNPIVDLTLPQLASLRKATSIPMDFHVWAPESFGGSQRFYDAPEVARLCSPCYFKIEPGPNLGEFYSPWSSIELHVELVRKKVKWGQIIINLVRENQPEIKVSEQGPDDLCIPKMQ